MVKILHRRVLCTCRWTFIQYKDVTMTDQQIIDLFDSSNITLRELAAISGRSVADLKVLLMGGAH